MKPTVYLAGPITGLNYEGATDWRQNVEGKLADFGIAAYSPMRAKHYLASIAKLSGTGEEYAHMGVLSTARAVMTRDRWDATHRDLLFVNLLGADRVSIGTVMELAWADLCRIPIVCVMEKTGNIHEHMMVNEAIGFRVDTLEEAVELTKSILLTEKEAVFRTFMNEKVKHAPRGPRDHIVGL